MQLTAPTKIPRRNGKTQFQRDPLGETFFCYRIGPTGIEFKTILILYTHSPTKGAMIELIHSILKIIQNYRFSGFEKIQKCRITYLSPVIVNLYKAQKHFAGSTKSLFAQNS